MVLPCFVDAHTHLDKGHIGPRSPNPDGTFAGARPPSRPTVAALDGRRRPGPHGVRAALRLCPRHARPSARISTASGHRPASPGRSSPNCVSAGGAGSTSRPRRCSASTRARRRAHARRRRHGGAVRPVPRGRHLPGPGSAARPRAPVPARGRPRLGPRLPRRRDRRPLRQHPGHDRRDRARHQFEGASWSAIAAPCPSCRTPSGSARSTSWPGRGSRSCRCPCATCTCRIGRRPRPHAALARRHGLQGARSAPASR